MAEVNGVVEGVSTKFGKYSILVNGTWYSTKMEWAKVQPEKGAQVSFDDGGAKFLKNVKVLSGGSSSGSSAPAPSKGFNSLGVELGHAANLAMQVMLARSPVEPGTAEFYADFVDQTQAIFKVMKTLRTHYENGESTSLELESKVEAAEKRAAPKKRTVEEDLF